MVAPETVEQICQRMMNTRKYLVIATINQHLPGDVIKTRFISDLWPDMEACLVITEPTDREDMRAQRVAMGLTPKMQTRPPYKHLYYYRTVAE